MRRKISLYIGGRSVDLDEQSFVLFNYKMDDVTDPAIVKNAYTQQIRIPRTPGNNMILGHLNRPDRMTGNGINVLAKTPFEIYSLQGEILESGYIRIDGIEKDAYKVTLFGGLGSLLYGLSADVDGNTLNLSALTYDTGVGTQGYTADSPLPFSPSEAWEYLENEGDGDIWDIIQFVPMYNGLPDNFDADKAIVTDKTYDNLPTLLKDGDDVYTSLGGYGKPYVIKYGSKHYEWEVCDLRSYLQRPAINVQMLLGAIARYSEDLTGKKLTLDVSVYSIANIGKMWMTLPMLNEKYRSKTTVTMGELLENTMSPADFLIGFVKMFGMVFYTDHEKVTLMTRDAWYARSASEVIDLTKRIDCESISRTPVFAQSHYYNFAFKSPVEDKTLARLPGSVRVDTNYVFNDDTKDVMNGVKFKNPQVGLLYSPSFSTFFATIDNQTVENNYLPQSSFETIKAVMYKRGTTSIDAESKEIDIPGVSGIVAPNDYYFRDWWERMVGCDSSLKGADAAGMFVYFNGFRTTPTPIYQKLLPTETIEIPLEQITYRMTTYDAARVALNGGKDCWDLRPSAPSRTTIPIFSDFLDGQYLTFSGSSSALGIYERRWRAYIGDRYDKDTTKMTCKVDLAGLQVSQSLLRRIFWYDNCLWTLNAVKNYSLTTYDLVECEFIRILNKENYTNGQS